MDIISSFRGHYRFLSNFFPANIEFEGDLYPSAEHAYQAAKSKDRKYRERIRDCGAPGSAKALGQRVPLREDWEGVKLDIMLGILRSKFEQLYFRDLLLATCDAELKEGNNWGDRFWGVVDGKGQNHLGRLLMKVRDELRQKHEQVGMD